MNYDDYKIGLHDSDSPMNKPNGELDDDFGFLKETPGMLLTRLKVKCQYQEMLLKEAGGIFELYRMTGSITEKELNRLTEIFEPYLL